MRLLFSFHIMCLGGEIDGAYLRKGWHNTTLLLTCFQSKSDFLINLETVCVCRGKNINIKICKR